MLICVHMDVYVCEIRKVVCKMNAQEHDFEYRVLSSRKKREDN